jgi:hypothetical protein
MGVLHGCIQWDEVLLVGIPSTMVSGSWSLDTFYVSFVLKVLLVAQYTMTELF